MTIRALITGISGQDGSYLAEAALARGWEVHGVSRDADRATERLSCYPGFPLDRITLHTCDLADEDQVGALLSSTRPDRLFHLAGQSGVAESFRNPANTARENVIPPLCLIRGVLDTDLLERTRLFFACSSEIFAPESDGPWSETTPLGPVNPYGVSKAFVHLLAHSYRISHRLFISSGILFNHESPRRPPTFLSRKVVLGVRTLLDDPDAPPMTLGALESARDWGYAPDFVDGMARALDQDEPDDYVFATGTVLTVRRFVEAVFLHMGGISLAWTGVGADERGRDAASGRPLITVDPALWRPVDLPSRSGDASKAARLLGWRPDPSFERLVALLTAQ